jgi:membrane protein implicated in regulation of membrane protease activity
MILFYLFLIIGVILFIGELHTNTFYMLVIGISSLIASVFAVFFQNPIIPIFASAICSIIGCIIVYRFLPNKKSSDMVVKHVGQNAEVVEVTASVIRVLYSGSYWNATVLYETNIEVGDVVRIVKFTNSMLTVEKVE